MALYLTEEDVAGLLTPADAVDVVEACFERMARGAVENMPRRRLRLDEGLLAVMAASDLELGRAGLKSYAAFGYGDVRFVVLIFGAERAELLGGLLGGSVVSQIADRDPRCPALGESERDAAADAARSACHEDRLAFEDAAHAESGVARPWLGSPSQPGRESGSSGPSCAFEDACPSRSRSSIFSSP